MTLVIAWRTTKLIGGGHRGLQAYRRRCYYFYVFYVFYVFFKIPKKRDFLRFFAVFHTFSRTMSIIRVHGPPLIAWSIFFQIFVVGYENTYCATEWVIWPFNGVCLKSEIHEIQTLNSDIHEIPVAALAIGKAGPRPCHFRPGPTSGPATRPGSQKSKISKEKNQYL